MKSEQYKQFQKLMILAQNGDEKAYSKLLNELYPLLKNFINKRIFDDFIVEDVVQETFMGIHKMRHTYNPKQPFETWFFAIARYKIIDAIRAQKRKNPEGSISLNNPDEKISETIWDTKANTYAGAIRYDIEKALNTLNPKQRKIITMLKIEGYTNKEVGEKLGLSTSAVKITAHRTYKILKDYFND